MAVLPLPLPLAIPAAPFFQNKARAFWNLQGLGWAAVFVLRAALGLTSGQPISFAIPVLISVVTGYSLTLILSVFYRRLINRRPLMTWSITLLLMLIATGLYGYIDAWVITIQNPDSEVGFVPILLSALFINGIVLSAWSALYYAINYFLRVEEQADQLVLLEAQAASAQLAMLRYQLNPHFLFNTLNSISTLVLLKQTEPANAMLARLSAFLRHTLAYEPTAQVTLEQEVETLKLYLDIEKMRFEDRLQTRFEIDPAVTRARLPSLLLQPLIENAIKYAVTPQEEGAEIAVAAQLNGQNVRISVSDTGPGLHGAAQRPSYSTGVGLANTRDRLAQAYGDRHSFETLSPDGGGFIVTLEMPLIQQEQTAELLVNDKAAKETKGILAT
jgi:signal transduction histidine kinase